MERQVSKAAVVGAGVIGAGWVARLIENGVAVSVYDPAPGAGDKIAAVLENADRAYAKLSMAPRGQPGAWAMAGSVAEAVADAELIVEAVPERLDLKRAGLFGDRGGESRRPDRLFDLRLQADGPAGRDGDARAPGGRAPVQPGLSVAAGGGRGRRGDGPRRGRARDGDLPRPRHASAACAPRDRRLPGDRFLEAVWREALWLVKDDIATTAEIDDAIRYGFVCDGLRWGCSRPIGLRAARRGCAISSRNSGRR